MKIDDIKVVAVVGAGAIGHAIAQEYARAGFQVRLNDVTHDRLQQAMAAIRANLEMLVGMGLVSAENVVPTLDRLYCSTDLGKTVSEADVVVEVVPENLKLKLHLFRRLDRLCPQHTIFASNSSSLMPGVLAAATDRADRFLVTHFLMPPYLLPLVEVVRGPSTSDETVTIMCELLLRLEKTPVVLQKEVPGYAVNRLQCALLREAFSLVEEGVLAPQDIDSIFTHALGPRWAAAGPFEILHIIGLDLWMTVLEYLLPRLAVSTEAPTLLKDTIDHIKAGNVSSDAFLSPPADGTQATQRRIAEAIVRLRTAQS